MVTDGGLKRDGSEFAKGSHPRIGLTIIRSRVFQAQAQAVSKNYVQFFLVSVRLGYEGSSDFELFPGINGSGCCTGIWVTELWIHICFGSMILRQ